MNEQKDNSFIAIDNYENICGSNNELIQKTKELIPKLPKEVRSELNSLSDMIRNVQNVESINLHDKNVPKKNQRL